jgi:hypothetical protein
LPPLDRLSWIFDPTSTLSQPKCLRKLSFANFAGAVA